MLKCAFGSISIPSILSFLSQHFTIVSFNLNFAIKVYLTYLVCYHYEQSSSISTTASKSVNNSESKNGRKSVNKSVSKSISKSVTNSVTKS